MLALTKYDSSVNNQIIGLCANLTHMRRGLRTSCRGLGDMN